MSRPSRLALVVIATFLATTLAACGPSPQQKVVGTWMKEGPGGDGLQLDADGVAHRVRRGHVDATALRWALAANQFTLEAQVLGTKQTQAFAADLQADKLTLTGPGSSTPTVFVRSSLDAMAAAARKPKGWSYDRDQDKLRGTENVRATTYASSDSDAEPASLVVRSRAEDGLAVFVVAPEGLWFACFRGCQYSIRFDDDPVRKVFFTPPDNSVATSVFFRDEKKILERLKTAKLLIVEAEMVNVGTRQFAFDVSGLAWP